MTRITIMMAAVGLALATTAGFSTGCIATAPAAEPAKPAALALFPDLSDPDCTTLRARVEQAMHTSLKVDAEQADTWGPIVAALARCDEGPFLFERVIVADQPHRPVLDDPPWSFGAALLARAHTLEPEALFATYQRYLEGHPGASLFGTELSVGHAAARVGRWLVKAERADQCQPLARAAMGTPPAVRVGFLEYFRRARCAEAAPLLADLLKSTRGDDTVGVCKVLGEIGTTSELAAVQIVARTDKTSRDIEQPPGSGKYVKDYYVADACSTAAGQIAQRGR